MKNILAITRITFGSIFLWAFLDKLLGLGFATCRNPETMEVVKMCEKAWVNGGSPTVGFLKFGTHGPLLGFYQSLAGQPIVDMLFMAGLLLIGIALVLGIGIRLAMYGGVLLMLMMWSAAFPPANHPLVDDHIIYALLFVILYISNAGEVWGMGKKWKKSNIVKKYPILG